MSDPPLNVPYWASLYRMYEEDNEQYVQALAEPDLVERARQLWQWKDLSRSIDFNDIAPIIEQLDIERYLNEDPSTAVGNVRDRLREEGVISGSGLVTPSFLLHLAASGPDESSATFPIYDRRVWNAYAYLWGILERGERLSWAASQSTARYGEFCQTFRDSCPDNDPRRYEQALFMFGGYITDLGSDEKPTEVTTIDRVLTEQEQAIEQMQGRTGYAMVDVDAVVTR
jgi:hypothetical protein